uniref:Uncharacterized protein n=1 Tax=Papilio xuthus TaxID=66420 RepID=I4DLN9_PAPXU|nr:unknown unsecreted protein [Papilio xuthus]
MFRAGEILDNYFIYNYKFTLPKHKYIYLSQFFSVLVKEMTICFFKCFGNEIYFIQTQNIVRAQNFLITYFIYISI